MGKYQRTKGSKFERRFAKVLLEACKCLGVCYRDCFRTPLSGGHPGGDAGDLQLSPVMKALVPWAIECKHHAKWKPSAMFAPRQSEIDWMVQAEAAGKKMRLPAMLVMSGNHTGVFVAAPFEEFVRLYPDLTTWVPSLLFTGIHGRTWLMIREEDYAYHLGLAAQASLATPKKKAKKGRK